MEGHPQRADHALRRQDRRLPMTTITTAYTKNLTDPMPAIDIGVPVGTPAFAATNGLAIRIDQPDGCGWGYQINGDDGNAYIYCHFSNPIVASGTQVRAGDQLGFSGGAKGAAGAGNSTGAHLHFGIRRSGLDWCPQPVL